MNIFEFEDYRAALKESLLLQKEQHGRPFTFQAMATACRVQKAYLSKVLGGDGHLSDDQLFLAMEFLKFAAKERRYVTLLHALGRCSVPTRHRELTKELAALRRQNLQTDQHLSAEAVTVGNAEMTEYYLDPATHLTHMFLSVKRYAREPSRIALELGLTKAQLSECLARLLKLGIIGYENGVYRVLRDSMHLAPGTKVFEAYRTLLRLRSLERITRLSETETYNFSATFSADDVTRAAIQARLLEVIRAAEGLVKKAPQEDVYQLQMDLFKWSQ